MQQLFINGQWVTGQGAELISTNPATNAINWQGSSAGSADVDAAFNAAEAAFRPWALTPLATRLEILSRYQALLQANQAALANDIMIDTGKPHWESQTEVATMIAKIGVSIQSYHERTGTKQSGQDDNQTALTHRPHGVCAVFGPYNFPGHLPNGHIIPALIAGNTLVFKPSEQTPCIGARMVALFAEAGIPNGVINFVPGELDTAKLIVGHPKLEGFFFTGSSGVGQQIHKQFAGQTGKMLALEMGGNNPLIVMDDAPVEAAVYHTIQSAFITTGQRCTCARRLIVMDTAIGETFINHLVSATKQLVIDEPTANPAPFYSTVVNQKTADNLLAAQDKLIALGGKCLLTMQRLQTDQPYISPAIIDMTGVSDIPDEEYFGPILKVYRVSNLEEAITLANDTQFGLSAGIFTENDEYWQQFYQLSKAGIVNRNKPLTGASGAAPFGGTGSSGNHRPGAYYAADYCAYPVASVVSDKLILPEVQTAGITAGK